MHSRTRPLFIASGIFVFIALWTLLVIRVGPSGIVSFIGVERGYLFIFLFALSGGLSSVTAFSFFVTIATFAVGGLNPLFLGLVGGAGITLGDGLFYYLGMKGRAALNNQFHHLRRFSAWLNGKEHWKIWSVIYIYCSFTFLPNDILAVALAFARYPFHMAMIPIFLGNVTLILLISFLAHSGVGLFT